MNREALVLTVSARPQNLAVVRQALAGYAEEIGLDQGAIDDLKTVVTEASMNAVVHAYPEDELGPLEISARPHASGIEVSVRDHGEGFRPRPSVPEDQGLRLGLPLIAALSEQFEIRGGKTGTEMRMVLPFSRNGHVEMDQAVDQAGAARRIADNGTSMSISAGSVVRPVLARVIGALAARAEFSIDRLADTILLGDAVSAHRASDFRDGTVGIEIMDKEGRLDVRVGPLVQGAAERIADELELPGGTSLRKLASELTVQPGADGLAEFLIVGIDR